MKPPKEISLDELMEEMEKYRGISHSPIELTAEQRKFLIAARTGDRKVSYPKLKMLWAKKWKPISESSIKRRCIKIL